MGKERGSWKGAAWICCCCCLEIPNMESRLVYICFGRNGNEPTAAYNF